MGVKSFGIGFPDACSFKAVPGAGTWAGVKYGTLAAALFTGADSCVPFSEVGTVLRLVMIGSRVACGAMLMLD